ncbi:plasmid partitioning protein RepB C-terminal domain-containing protein [Oleidesulfovibrio sp.]|uniref:ParB/RepB/Spo0J family partition protein n=1 Tax=Oleidesulfovibrio sp. TaxID=2909707 RepID=UPI003A87D60F
MADRIKQGFQTELIELEVFDLHQTRRVFSQSLRGRKYIQILSSIKEVGLIEAPVVSPLGNGNGYLLLDGHLRLAALKELGIERVSCLVATEDEAYTYNKYINKLSAIQEHRMIVKAIEAGVSEEKLAAALNLELRTIRNKKYLLAGVSSEVVELLKDKPVPEPVFRVLKRMKAARQLTVAMLMNDQNKFSSTYAKALLNGTPTDQLIAKGKPTQGNPAILARQARLEEESLALSQEVCSLKEQYGIDMVDFISIQSYLKRLLGNEEVTTYLQKYHEAIFEKFKEMVELDLFKFKGIT